MKYWFDDHKQPSSLKNSEIEINTNHLSGKEMSTMKLVGRIHRNIGVLEGIIEKMFEREGKE